MKLRKSIFLAAAVLAFAAVTTVSAKPLNTIEAGPGIAVVETKAGTVQGYVHNGVYTYHGIPYAQAERFADPAPLPHWDGIRTALVFGDMAPQDTSRESDMFPNHWNWPYWEPHNLPTSENCLNLNVWTPSINDGKKRPVMVWFHGGGFMVGGSISDGVYDGENLARTGDVVVVSVNHRLNSLGFLDLSDYGDEFKTNVGLKDLVASLEWVRDNIARFGGDPNNVTIFGQSGGGAKVLSLMCAPKAQGLFHKGICESGGTRFVEKADAKRIAEGTLKNLGITRENISDIKTIPYETLAKAADAAKASLKIAEWRPILDGDYIPVQIWGDEFPSFAKDVPLLIGSNLNEWMSIMNLNEMATLQSDNKNTWGAEEVSRRMRAQYGDKADQIASAFKTAYPTKKPADALFVDTMFRSFAKRMMDLKARQNAAPVYAYIFAWETPIMGGYAMSYHCSELPFVFNNIDLALPATGGSKEARALATKMSAAWVNFARTGNPNAKGLPKWEAYTTNGGATMLFDNKCEIVRNHDTELQKLLPAFAW